MTTFRSLAASAAVALALTLCWANSAQAQSILSNIPSTDTMPEGAKYVEFGFTSDFRSHAEGGFETYGVKTLYGVNKNLEVGATVSMADALESGQPVFVKPNVKWRFLNSEKTGVAASVGAMLFAPVTHANGVDTFGMVYAVASKKVHARYGPRFTGGAYGLVGRTSGSRGSEAGALVGFEQPLHRRLSFAADWYSGRNGFGYATPGFIFSLSKNTGGFVGYTIGNDGANKNRFVVSYGVRF
jgi:hypothetical protein